MQLLINYRGKRVSLSAYKEYLKCKDRVEAAKRSGREPDPQDEYDYLNFLGVMTNSEKKKRYAALKKTRAAIETIK